MAFNVKPFKEVLAMTKEKIDEALAPVRARAARAKADLEMARLDEKLLAAETDVHKLCSAKELEFDRILDKIDEYELLERRRNQIKKLITDLFPE